MIRDATILVGSMLVIVAGVSLAPALPSIAGAFADTPNVDLLSKNWTMAQVPAGHTTWGSPRRYLGSLRIGAAMRRRLV